MKLMSQLFAKNVLRNAAVNAKTPTVLYGFDCDLGKGPRPARYATPFKDLREHWTLSYFHRKEQRTQEVVVMGVKCGVCYLEVE